MRKRTVLNALVASLVVILLILASCATPTPQTVVETVIVKEQVTVMVEGTPQIKEVEKIVEKVVEVTPTPAGPVEITYTYAGPGVPQDLQEVQDAINAILIPKINVKLTLDPMDWGTFGERMQLKMAAGEECDIVFTAPWINNYYINVINGALYPLDDLLPEYAPGLWASISPSTWEAARVKGNIYSVINQQIWPKPWGVHVIEEFADKYTILAEWDGRILIDKYDGDERWCVFLQRGRNGLYSCRVQDAKPSQCLGFPFKWRSSDAIKWCEGLKE